MTNKRPLISSSHYTTEPDPRFVNMTLTSGQPYHIVTNENNVNKSFNDELNNKIFETNPPVNDTINNTMSATPVIKFDMPNYATDFDKLHETLTMQEISYLITIDPPSLVELDVSHSDEETNGCQDDLQRGGTELHWEVTSSINETVNVPDAEVTGEFEIVDVTYN